MAPPCQYASAPHSFFSGSQRWAAVCHWWPQCRRSAGHHGELLAFLQHLADARTHGNAPLLPLQFHPSLWKHPGDRWLHQLCLLSLCGLLPSRKWHLGRCGPNRDTPWLALLCYPWWQSVCCWGKSTGSWRRACRCFISGGLLTRERHMESGSSSASWSKHRWSSPTYRQPVSTGGLEWGWEALQSICSKVWPRYRQLVYSWGSAWAHSRSFLLHLDHTPSPLNTPPTAPQSPNTWGAAEKPKQREQHGSFLMCHGLNTKQKILKMDGVTSRLQYHAHSC